MLRPKPVSGIQHPDAWREDLNPNAEPGVNAGPTGRRGDFTATGHMEAEPGGWFVRKDSVDYQLWNRLIGVTNPERLGQASGGATS
ncbi:MAG TPA: hypothetical protein VF157_03920 [Chloroflexota bacterium]